MPNRNYESCCWDEVCPQHRQMQEIHAKDGYPFLDEEQRKPGWFKRRIEAWDKLLNGGPMGTGGRA